MKVKREVRTIEKAVMVYTAEDGKEFFSERECREYENQTLLAPKIAAAEKLRIEELNGVIPLVDYEAVAEYSTYSWYEVKNEEEYEVLDDAYGGDVCVPKNYPEIICMESTGGEAYMGDSYCYMLSEIRETTEKFWEKMGYEVMLTKKAEEQ